MKYFANMKRIAKSATSPFFPCFLRPPEGFRLPFDCLAAGSVFPFLPMFHYPKTVFSKNLCCHVIFYHMIERSQAVFCQMHLKI
ncbi:MAG: hypothetical protein IKB22_04635, partial [Lentisphaeria bacterium]|nr:hypothetical protein [Lentisphaeria bacterium]